MHDQNQPYRPLDGRVPPSWRSWQRTLFTALATVVAILALNSTPAQAATIAVDGTTCTLVDAITAANTEAATGGCAAGSGADTITLLADVTLTVVNNGRNGLPAITSEILIEGNGFTIARDASAPEFRILAVNASGNLTLNATTISGGSLAVSSGTGGGIENAGTLTLNNSTLSNNAAFFAGGINNTGTLTLNNSTVSGNSATVAGGAIFNDGTAATATLNNTTVSNNTSSSSSSDLFNNGNLLMIFNNSILVNSGANSVCRGSTSSFTSLGHNLDSDGSCKLTASSDIANGVANLGPLQINAPGNTPTHALLPGSQAIDAGDCSGGASTTDQRGVSRPQGSACDIGAFEFEQAAPPVIACGVVGWGGDNNGQATPPAGLTDIVALAAGGAFQSGHSLALKADGTVVGWGNNTYGQATVPPGLSDVVALAAGSQHSLALKADGTVVAWGLNNNGQATPPAGLSDVVALAAGGGNADGHSLALKADGTVVAWGLNNSGQATVPPGLNNVVAIAAGAQHSLALKSDGTVVVWGNSAYGITTPPAGLNDVTTIAAGDFHNLALKSDGTVVAWGYNLFNQSTVPAGLGDVTAIAAGSNYNVVLKSDGTVAGWGKSFNQGAEIPPAGLSDVVAIAAGASHSLASVSVCAPTNNPPTVAVDNASITVDEGQTASNTGTLSDPEGDPVTLSADVGTVVNNNDGTWSWSLATVDGTPSQTVTISADDGNGGMAQTTFALTVNDVLPIATARINGTDCDLIDAITAANTDAATGTCAAGTPGADTIEMLTDVTLTSVNNTTGNGDNGLPLIVSPITLEGAGFTIARDGAAPGFRILEVAVGGDLTVNNTTIIGGQVPVHKSGGGVFSNGQLTLNNSTVSASSADVGGGIGLLSGTTTLNNSTVSGNTANVGGGIGGLGTLNLNNSTVSANTANLFAGGLSASGDVYMSNSIVANQANGTDCDGSVISLGYNLDSDDSCGLNAVGDIANGVANLGPLQVNAPGNTPTHALLPGSHALDAAPSGLATDQRGVARPQGCAFDIGAFELEWSPVCNTPPVAADDSYSTNEDAPLTVPAPGVLANDSDGDGNPITAQPVTGPANGTLLLSADGSFTYTPDANFFGTDSFTYVANDGVGALGADSNVATVNLTINAVNDAPSAMDDSYSTNEDTPLTVVAPGLLGNDSDIEGNPLSAVQVSGPANGTVMVNSDGSFTYMPNANFNGSDSFTYKANDGVADSTVATVNITVDAVNDAPVAADDSYATDEDTVLNLPAPGVLANDSDIEGNPLTAALVDAPLNGSLTLNADGSFTYTPNANFNGSDSFTYQVNDGMADSNLATVLLTVDAVNDAPVATNDSYLTDEDVPLTVPAPGVQDNDNDLDGDALSSVVVSGAANGSVTLNGDGSFTYTPNQDYNGSDSFTYQLNDGAASSNVATVTIVIGGVNDAPVAADDSYATDEDMALNVPAPGVLANDNDVDNDPLTIALVDAPLNGTLTLNGDGSFSYTPAANFNGSDSFTYQLNDGAATSAVATVSITVNAVNDAPVAANDSYNTNEDVALTIAAPGLLGNDTDGDGDALNAVLVSGPANGSLALNGDGSFSYTPNANFNGSDSFSYQVNDGQVNSNVATVALTIVAVNDPPVAGNDSYSTNEDTALSVPAPGVLGNDSDPVEGSPVTAVLVSAPANGSLTLNADGSFIYTPNANYSGSDSFTYQANDGGANSNIATVSITVISASDLIDTLIANVQTLVDSGALSGPKSSPLINGLNNAQNHLMKGQTAQAIKKLEDFIKDVNGLVSRGELTAAQGQALIDDASAIIVALS